MADAQTRRRIETLRVENNWAQDLDMPIYLDVSPVARVAGAVVK